MHARNARVFPPCKKCINMVIKCRTWIDRHGIDNIHQALQTEVGGRDATPRRTSTILKQARSEQRTSLSTGMRCSHGVSGLRATPTSIPVSLTAFAISLTPSTPSTASKWNVNMSPPASAARLTYLPGSHTAKWQSRKPEVCPRMAFTTGSPARATGRCSGGGNSPPSLLTACSGGRLLWHCSHQRGQSGHKMRRDGKGRTNRKVVDEISVTDVDMYPVCARPHCAVYVFCQVGEVRCEDRGRNYGPVNLWPVAIQESFLRGDNNVSWQLDRSLASSLLCWANLSSPTFADAGVQGILHGRSCSRSHGRLASAQGTAPCSLSRSACTLHAVSGPAE